MRTLTPAALRRRTSRGPVAVVGPTGAGRTRLLEAASAGTDGSLLLRARPGLRGTPLAIFATADSPLSAAAAVADPTDRIRRISDLLHACAGAVLAVDDVHWCDSTSVDLLLALADRIRLLVSVDTHHPWPEAVVDLVARCTTVSPEPCDTDEVAEIATDRLGGRLDQSSLHRLGLVSGDRPGHVVRILTAHEDAVEEVDGFLRLPPRLGAAARLRGWARARLATSTPDAVSTMRRVAAHPELTTSQVTRLVGTDALDELVDQRLLEVSADDEPPRVLDPLLRRVLVDAMAPVHAVADAELLLETLGAQTPPDVLARWELTAGRVPGPDGIAAALTTALQLGDLGTARRLATLVSDADAGHLQVLRGETFAACGDLEAAVAVATRAAKSHDASVAARARLLLADLLFFRCGDIDGAIAVLDGHEPADPSAAAEHDALRALLHSLTPTDAPSADRCTRTDPRPSGVQPPTSRGPGSTLEPPYARLLADLFGALDVTLPADAPVDELTRSVPTLLTSRARTNARMHALYLGDLATATECVERDVQTALRTDRPGAVGLALLGLAEVQWFRGRLVDAEATVREARLHLRRDDESGVRGPATAFHAMVLAEVGQLSAARDTLTHMAAQEPDDIRTTLLAGGARLRLQAVEAPATVSATAARLLSAGLAANNRAWAALAVSHALRMGLAADLADRLEQVTADTVGELLPAIGGLARAVADADPRALRQVGARLAAVGTARFAADAWLLAARVEDAPGRARDDRRRAAAALRDLGPPRPAGVASGEELTDRERQVARLAADGETSQVIAGRLGLSRRTIDNHLGRAYRKLGIAGRDGLVEILLT